MFSGSVSFGGGGGIWLYCSLLLEYIASQLSFFGLLRVIIRGSLGLFWASIRKHEWVWLWNDSNDIVPFGF